MSTTFSQICLQQILCGKLTSLICSLIIACHISMSKIILALTGPKHNP